MRLSICAIILVTTISTACGVGPIRAVQGARHYSAGTEFLHAGEAQSAVQALERAAILVPRASEIQNHLGLAYWAAERHADARGAFERALEIDCENEAARTNLDRLLAQSSRPFGRNESEDREHGG